MLCTHHCAVDSADQIEQALPPARYVGEEDHWGALDEDNYSDRRVVLYLLCLLCLFRYIG